jgi:hypothetical protein
MMRMGARPWAAVTAATLAHTAADADEGHYGRNDEGGYGQVVGPGGVGGACHV